MWNDKSIRAGIVVHIATACLTQWERVQGIRINPSGLAHSAGSLERWTKPHENGVKINCDAFTFTNPDRVGLGWLARNSAGGLLVAGRRCIKGTQEATGQKQSAYWKLLVGSKEKMKERDC